jgi:RNA polymerase sigma-70 factor (ECF subfamily)
MGYTNDYEQARDLTQETFISLALEEVPQPEIAAIVGLTETNIRVKIHRIKERLSGKFKDHGQFE